MNIKKNFLNFIWPIFFTIALVFGSCIKGFKEKKILKIGINSPFPPFEFVDKDGNFDGMDIDIAKEIAKRLNLELNIVDIDFDALIISLNSDKIDLILAGLSMTEDRLKAMDMIPYHNIDDKEFALLFWGSAPDGIFNWQDFARFPEKSVCVQSGTTQGFFFEKNYPEIKVLSLNNVDDIMLHLRYNKILAAVVDKSLGRFIAANNSDIMVKFFDVGKSVEPEGIGIKKGNDELKKAIDNVINEMIEDGTLKSLENKWFS